jgi:hypothetical protein
MMSPNFFSFRGVGAMVWRGDAFFRLADEEARREEEEREGAALMRRVR